jgi:hypothetical protein
LEQILYSLKLIESENILVVGFAFQIMIQFKQINQSNRIKKKLKLSYEEKEGYYDDILDTLQ